MNRTNAAVSWKSISTSTKSLVYDHNITLYTVSQKGLGTISLCLSHHRIQQFSRGWWSFPSPDRQIHMPLWTGTVYLSFRYTSRRRKHNPQKMEQGSARFDSRWMAPVGHVAAHRNQTSRTNSFWPGHNPDNCLCSHGHSLGSRLQASWHQTPLVLRKVMLFLWWSDHLLDFHCSSHRGHRRHPCRCLGWWRLQSCSNQTWLWDQKRFERQQTSHFWKQKPDLQ